MEFECTRFFVFGLSNKFRMQSNVDNMINYGTSLQIEFNVDGFSNAGPFGIFMIEIYGNNAKAKCTGWTHLPNSISKQLVA